MDSLPSSMILKGDIGSGRHLMCEYIASLFKLKSVDITKDISLDTINDMYSRVEPYLYIIDTSKITEKDQNTILKILEEPLKNSHLVLLSVDSHSLLQTVKNRCFSYELDKYSINSLMSFVDTTSTVDELLFEVADTPGQVLTYSKINFVPVKELAEKFVEKIGMATLPNALTITNKLKFSDKDNSEIDPNLFLKLVMYYIVHSDTYNIAKKCSLETYTYKLMLDYQNNNFNKKWLFDRYIVDFRNVVRRE